MIMTSDQRGMIMNSKYKGILEVDHERGVIYFHLDDQQDIERLFVIPALRICRLPKPIPTLNDHKLLDITHMVGTSWQRKEEKKANPVDVQKRLLNLGWSLGTDGKWYHHLCQNGLKIDEADILINFQEMMKKEFGNSIKY
jgi:hypothetical protein